MPAMRNKGNDSGLTQWLWAGCITLSVSRPTPNRKREKHQTFFRGLAKLPLGEWWQLLNCRTCFLSLTHTSINNHNAKTVRSTQITFKIVKCNNWLRDKTLKKKQNTFTWNAGKMQVKIQVQQPISEKMFCRLTCRFEPQAKPSFPTEKSINVCWLGNILCLLWTLTI